jgi:GMP synthase (glutamine-hydrolysing)
MQLLAVALGARLHLRHGTEIGFAPVELTERGVKDEVLGPCAGGSHATFLHWHSDAVDLPPGADLLASTGATPVQAFRLGTALGLQFHLEADAALLEAWLATQSMVGGLSAAEVTRIRRDGETHLPGLRAPALEGLAAFAAAVRKRRG